MPVVGQSMRYVCAVLRTILPALLLSSCAQKAPATVRDASSSLVDTDTDEVTEVTSTTTSTTTTTPALAPCTGVLAVLFDLGETLVTEVSPLSFVEKPGAVALVSALKADGVPIGVITNLPEGWSMQDLRDLLVNPGFLDAFDVVLPSSLADADPKPSPAIFVEAHALFVDPPPIQQTAFVTEELLDIANREVNPTSGARAAGLVGVHLTKDPPSPLTDHVVDPDALASIATASWLGCPAD